jgi:hypothetical protein
MRATADATLRESNIEKLLKSTPQLFASQGDGDCGAA